MTAGASVSPRDLGPAASPCGVPMAGHRLAHPATCTRAGGLSVCAGFTSPGTFRSAGKLSGGCGDSPPAPPRAPRPPADGGVVTERGCVSPRRGCPGPTLHARARAGWGTACGLGHRYGDVSPRVLSVPQTSPELRAPPPPALGSRGSDVPFPEPRALGTHRTQPFPVAFAHSGTRTSLSSRPLHG